MDRAPYVALQGVDGSLITLSSGGDEQGLFLARGATGLDMLPWDVQVDEFPALDGEFPRAVRGKAREIFLPLTAYGTTRQKARTKVRALLRALNPGRLSQRMAKLIVAEPLDDGSYETQREIEVYYSSGMEGDEGSSNGLSWQTYGLVLRSTDPFFQDRQDTQRAFELFGALSDFFPDEGLPFLSADGLSGGFRISEPPTPTDTITVHNPGDVPVYPTWSIPGPLFGDFSLHRQATEFSPEGVLTITGAALAEGQTMTLTTSPGQMRATGSVGAGFSWANLGANPQFWALDPGDNIVQLRDFYDGFAFQNVLISFRPKYITA